MNLDQFRQRGPCEWEMPRRGAMRVPGVIFASRELLAAMDAKVGEQLANVAALPGIVDAAYAMPDAHWGYGFPIGGVAAFDADAGGVVSAGGVGFDISCGVRSLHTGLQEADLLPVQERLADLLFRRIPAGLGSTGALRLSGAAMGAMLRGGARWAVEQGFGSAADLACIEEGGCMAGAVPAEVSAAAKQRQRDEMGTLGSGNHYLEVQVVDELFDARAAQAYGLAVGDVLATLHCGSRGLGHQIGTDFLREMVIAAPRAGIALVDRELACAPLKSDLGQSYLGAMRAAINCALANRQILTHLAREAFAELFPGIAMPLLYDVSHNTCKEESPAPPPVRASQGRHPRLRPRPPRAAGRIPRGRPAGADRRQHGHRLLGAGRHGRCARAGLRLGLPRRRAGDEPPRGAAPLAGPRGGRRAGAARHPDPQPEPARRRRGGAAGLQGRRRGGRGRRAGRPGAARGAAAPAALRQGLSAAQAKRSRSRANSRARCACSSLTR